MSTKTTRVGGDILAVPAAVSVLWLDYVNTINAVLTAIMSISVITFTVIRIYYLLKNKGKQDE